MAPHHHEHIKHQSTKLSVAALLNQPTIITTLQISNESWLRLLVLPSIHQRINMLKHRRLLSIALQCQHQRRKS